MSARDVVLAGWALSPGGASDDTGVRVLALVVLALVLAGATVGGALAYAGRWRSWYPDRYRLTYMPLAVPWFTGAVLLMGLLVGLDTVLDSPPLPVAGLGILLALACLLVAGIYAIHPPRQMLPRWIRHLEGDPSVPASDRGPDQ